jgi:hypothetical protein
MSGARPEQPGIKPKSEPPPTPALDSAASTPTPIPSAASPPATDSLQVPPTTTAATPMNSIIRRNSSQNLSVPSLAHDSVSPITPSNPPPPTPANALPQTDEDAQDHLYQEAITKLLSSPNALQRILAMVSTQGPEPPLFNDSQSELAPYYGSLMNMDTGPDPQLAYAASQLDQSTDALGQQVLNTEQEIDNLIRDWGVAPEMLQDHQVGEGHLPNGFVQQNGFGEPHAFVPNGDFTHMNGLDATNQPTGYASIAPEGGTLDINSFLNQFEFPDDPSTSIDPSQHANGLGVGLGATSNGTFPVPLAAEFDLANPGPQSASFLDEVHPIPSAASDTSLSPSIPLLDDFSQAANSVVPTSPTAARFPTPSTPSAVTTPVPNGTPAAPAAKRGRKRRSVPGETPEELNISTRAGRK